ncbi:DUF3068 domain-containing protein [Planomonospora parontospora]|uniref:DUF3068 domain-containing protein n=1 Tax=Planomonospora parontospora TaxID=58119 RepID=UPI0016700142|nr:DUF3068 domain-containing protein [Planomonospora parontospora]GGL08357.1 hypothetical protein GCM10014719_08010 [Planomonospora parontospora subsp. antibiotica]GII14544.1 hypothetical protein Ppa05_12700 [Planomonospora parontospora subsp. antibiotica]
MRRIVGIVLLALGAFLIVLAPLVRFQVAGSLVAAPAAQYGISKLEAEGAQYFSARDLKVMTAQLGVTVTTRGDVSQAKGDTVVWDEFTAVNDVTNSNPNITITERRSAFNKYTGEGVTCCSVNIDDRPVTMEGQIYKWPFDVEQKTYKVFNSVAGRAFDARFVGEEQVNGLTAYKFEQDVPETKTETRSVPASVMGVTDVTGDVQVDRVYKGRNTFWIEPVTGSPVKQEQRRDEVLRTQDGAHSVTALAATIRMTPETVNDLVSNATESKNQISMIKVTIPLILLLLGLVLLVTGFFVARGADGKA